MPPFWQKQKWKSCNEQLVCISAHRIQIPSLLDSSSKVTLLWQLYFNKYILPKIKPATSEKTDAHPSFKLTVTNDGQMPIRMYTELDFTFLGLKVPNVGMLITMEPNQVLDKEHQTKLPGIVGWNLIWLSYNMFIEKYWTTGFDSFMCPEGVNPLLFSQLCIFYYSDIQKNQTFRTTSKVISQQSKHDKSPKTDDLCKKKTNETLKVLPFSNEHTSYDPVLECSFISSSICMWPHNGLHLDAASQ